MCCAAALRRSNVTNLVIVDRSSEVSAHGGTGIAIPPNGARALATVGLPVDRLVAGGRSLRAYRFLDTAGRELGCGDLIVLRQKVQRVGPVPIGLAQQGQRDRSVTRLTLRRRRSVVIECGTWRSGRSGGASGSVTLGKGRFFEDMSGARSRGGKSRPFGDQESISGNAHRRVMMEPSPASSFEMTEPDLLLQLLIIALDAPAHHGDIDHALEPGVLGQRGQPRISSAPSRPSATR